jgi:plastocyanin
MAGMHHASGSPKPRGRVKLPENTIGIDNFAFEPKVLSVNAGTTVTWTNRDDVPHLIISATGKFANSSVLDTDQSYSLTMPTPGEYPYFCSLHPKMIGKIVVR